MVLRVEHTIFDDIRDVIFFQIRLDIRFDIGLEFLFEIRKEFFSKESYGGRRRAAVFVCIPEE